MFWQCCCLPSWPSLISSLPTSRGAFSIAMMPPQDEVLVRSAQGTVKTVAKVTDCITPGVTALANGHWFQADENGVDVGGDVNTLVSSHPSPLAKAIPAHTNLVEVMKA